MEAKKDFTSTAHAAYFTPNSIDSKPLNFLLIQGLKVFPWVFLHRQFVWAINFVASLSRPSNYFQYRFAFLNLWQNTLFPTRQHSMNSIFERFTMR